MAAPNIVGLGTIIGITTALSPTGTSGEVILSNPANSGSVFKINSIICANNGAAAGGIQVTVKLTQAAAGAGSSTTLATRVGISSGSTLILTDRASSFYLEENKSIVVQTTVANNGDFTISYDKIN